MGLLLCIFSSFSSYAYQRADAFIVTAHPGFYRVLSPAKIDDKIGLIIQNKSLVKIYGRLEEENSKILETLNVSPDQSVSITFEFKKDKKYFFVPLSPAFQEVELKMGEKSYEVPAQRKEK